MNRLVEIVAEIGIIKEKYDRFGQIEGFVTGVLEEHFGETQVSGWAM